MVIENLNKGVHETYTVLAEFPFDSTRKRMSLVVKLDETIFLMCKGADSIVLPKINFKSEQ
jgi:magnesium-transporting ATPase (P-type)